MKPEQQLQEFVDEKMEEGGLEHLSDRDDLIEEVLDELCELCELADDCPMCHAAKQRIERGMEPYL